MIKKRVAQEGLIEADLTDVSLIEVCLIETSLLEISFMAETLTQAGRRKEEDEEEVDGKGCST